MCGSPKLTLQRTTSCLRKTRPVVASRISGFQLVMEHGRHGLMIHPADDATRFAEALLYQLDRPAERARMGRLQDDVVQAGDELGLLAGVRAPQDEDDAFVLGVEGDVTFTDWSDKVRNDTNSAESIKGDVNLLATLRLRAGFAVDNLLLYITGGGAIADATYDANDTAECCGTENNVDFNDIGFVVGGGAEWGLDGWTIAA